MCVYFFIMLLFWNWSKLDSLCALWSLSKIFNAKHVYLNEPAKSKIQKQHFATLVFTRNKFTHACVALIYFVIIVLSLEIIVLLNFIQFIGDKRKLGRKTGNSNETVHWTFFAFTSRWEARQHRMPLPFHCQHN